jgi:hypothetical protein
MADATISDTTDRVLRRAEHLQGRGEFREAVDALTEANRESHDPRLERALVRLRREGGAALPRPGTPVARPPLVGADPDGELVAVDAGDMTVSALRTGLARSGCLHVRGLVPPDRVARLAAGIDRALAAYDDSEAHPDTPVDPSWFSPFSMPARQPGVSQEVRRRFNRESGGLWTANSPRMLFELFEVVDESGIGSLMTEFLGERPLLSANKCTLRRVPPTAGLGGWHQDGAFLGEEVSAFNFWLALSDCGVDAPGMDIVPRRFEHVVTSGEGADFSWSLSDEDVHRAADGLPIVRPRFGAGDALLFDQFLVHRTAALPEMARERYAIEAWFFGPSAYPGDQLPLLY